MRKLVCLVFVAVLTLILVTKYGPWNTYRWNGSRDELGGTCYVQNLPVWFGEILRYTNGARTQREVFLDELFYNEIMIRTAKANHSRTVDMYERDRDRVVDILIGLSK